MNKATDTTAIIPTNMSRGSIVDAIDALCARLADLGDVEEAWELRGVLDEQYPESRIATGRNS